MKKIIWFLVFIMLFCFVSCKDNVFRNQNDIPQDKNKVYDYDDTVESEAIVGEYYEVTTNEDFTYNYRVWDKNGIDLISVENFSRSPHLSMIGNGVVSVSVQTGTGRSTNIVRYYNIETGEVSDTYQYVIGATSDKVVHIEFDEVLGYSLIVSEMFDKKAQIISVELDDVYANDPIVSEKISENMVEVAYLKGEDYVETKIKINLETGLYSKE